MVHGPTADRLVRSLPEYMPKDPDSGNHSLMKTIELELDDMHEDILELDRATTVQEADTIDQLEKLGAMVGLQHNPNDGKEKFRAKILSRYQLNASEGTPQHILESVATITDTDISNLRYYPLPDTPAEVSVGIPAQEIDGLPLSADEIANIVDNLAPAGKRVYARKRGSLQYITPEEYNNGNYEADAGYDGLDADGNQKDPTGDHSGTYAGLVE